MCSHAHTLTPHSPRSPLPLLAALTLSLCGLTPASLATEPDCFTLYPGPTYTHSPLRDGYIIPTLNGSNSVIDGVMIAYADLYINNEHEDTRALKLTPDGLMDMGLGYIQHINASGTSIGWRRSTPQGGFGGGNRVIRWAPDGIATVLGTLSTSTFGFTNMTAREINTAGAIVGSGGFYISGQDRGKRAVRWAPGAINPTQLNALNTDATGTTYSEANAINDAGTAVGYAQRWGPSIPPGGDDGGGTGYNGDRGQRAIRWAANSSVATELGHLGTNTREYTNAIANDINSNGYTIGWSNIYSADRMTWLGRRAVVWHPNQITPTVMQPLSLASNGFSLSDVFDINDANTIVGQSEHYNAQGVLQGTRAVMWNSQGYVTSLAPLSLDAQGNYESAAYDINESGYIVGRAKLYDAQGTFLTWRAVLWTPSNEVIDLTNLLPAGSGWVSLTSAAGISENTWISGVGTFDADGPGPQIPYSRMFLIELSLPNIATNHPTFSNICIGGPFEISVTATGNEPLTYQWFRNNEPIDSSLNPSALTDTLIIGSFLFSDIGTYHCSVYNACASSSISPVIVSACGPDVNCDGGVDGSDVEAFFLRWETGLMTADINNDGGVDGSDIELFFLYFSGGSC